MKEFWKKCKEKLFNTKVNTFLFFLFLVAFVAGVILLCTAPLGGGAWFGYTIMCMPFIVNIIGSFSDIQ